MAIVANASPNHHDLNVINLVFYENFQLQGVLRTRQTTTAFDWSINWFNMENSLHEQKNFFFSPLNYAAMHLRNLDKRI